MRGVRNNSYLEPPEAWEPLCPSCKSDEVTIMVKGVDYCCDSCKSEWCYLPEVDPDPSFFRDIELPEDFWKNH